ncbi:MAG: NTP transferase domain-containing protein [Muribaculaceae bacterium]|nr:NTP transferase domain-containing protein [Muribaculaceae bacterium]
MNYVILAAGLGSRFTLEGVNTPKPLVPILGEPMIGRLIRVLASAGDCESIHIVANPRMEGLIEYLEGLKSQGAPLEVKPYVSADSWSSLRVGAEGIEGKFIAMTVDAIFPNSEFGEFRKSVARMAEGEVMMALTRFIDDESPLYARLSPDSREVVDYRYGGEPFDEGAIVSAGIYGLTSDAIRTVEARESAPKSLSDFQRILAAETPQKVRVFEMSKALDVDCSHDREGAETFLREVNGEKPRRKSLRDEYKDSLKSLDTEEHIDLAFYRPIGFAWACLFRRLGVSPNAVTIASIFIGVAAGICFYPTALWINILGMLLLIWANSFDSADGQLARLTGQYSRLGRILDGVSGDFWFASIYIAICLRTVHGGHWWGDHAWVIWTLAILAGICHGKQAALADYYRQLHLRFLKGKSGSELESSARLAEADALISWRKAPVRKLISTLYLAYTRSQEAETPAMQRLRREVGRRWPDGHIPVWFRDEFLRLSLPLCKWENFMTFNWRTIFLFLTLFIGMPWTYFIIELTLFNIVMIATNLRHEHICKSLLKRLDD